MPTELQLTPEQPSDTAIELDDPALYFNRELSWLQFNARVCEEALDTSKPLLERVKFLAITATNLDEFFMVRVSALRRQARGGVLHAPPDGLTPTEQLVAIRRTLLPQLAQHTACWCDDLLSKLQEAGIHICAYDALLPEQRALLRRVFARDVFPVLTPLAFDPAHPFPHIANLSLNLAVVVNDSEQGEQFARLKIGDVLPRFVRVPDDGQTEADEPTGMTEGRTNTFVWIEDVVAANLDLLFPGLEIVASYPFRITRDADLEIRDDEAFDLLTDLEEQIERREFQSVVRLEVAQETPETIREVLIHNLSVEGSEVYTAAGPLGLADLMELTALDRPDLKDRPFAPAIPSLLRHNENISTVIRHSDVLLYHPYDSFRPVVDFVREAAHDPHVVAIKQTPYRVGSNSPIVEALLEAREQGKHVAVLVEPKARFDEESNILWARALENAGVHVAYGVLDHRVELLFPVEHPQLRDLIIQDILRVHLHDNVQARRLVSNGDYERLQPQPSDNVLSSQDWLLQHWKGQSH